MRGNPVFLCLDLGTSRVKAALVSASGTIVQQESARLDRTASPDFQDAGIWYALAAGLVKKMSSAPDWIAPEAVALTGNMHALLGLDSSGRPVADAELWCSGLASTESAELNRRYGVQLCERFGNPCIPVFTLPKLIRMAEREPGLYRRAACFLQSKDFLAYCLTGELATDPTDASGTLLYRSDTGDWDADLIRELGLDRSKLPEVRPSASEVGRVTDRASAETGLAAGTPVILGAGDLATAALGSAADEHTFSLTLGTAGQLLATGRKGGGAPLAGKLFVFAHADPARELYLGSVPGGGFSLEWLARTGNLTMERFFELASAAPLRADLPVFLPYLLGRGAPYMDYTPSAEWITLNACHSQGDLCRAAVFGTLAALRQSADLLERLAGPRENIVLQALACREKAVRETACALFGKQTKFLPRHGEASLLGAAVIAAVATGVYADFTAAQGAMFSADRIAPAPDENAETLFLRYLEAADALQKRRTRDKLPS